MNRTQPTIRSQSRRQLNRLKETIADQLPATISQRFDPAQEDSALGVLSLILFIQRHWRGIAASEQSLLCDWLVLSSDPILHELLDWAIGFLNDRSNAQQLTSVENWSRNDQGDVVERLMAAFDPRGRRRYGFYCTPYPLAQFVVRRVDRNLVQHFHMPGGILSTERAGLTDKVAPLNILDPAVGTGVFLSAIVNLLWRKFRAQAASSSLGRSWSDWVSQALLPRLFACDIQLGPLACAHIRLAGSLYRSGYSFATPVDLRLRRMNVLDTLGSGDASVSPASLRESNRAIAEFRATPFAVILGNPPYGAIQGRADESMRKLMHGRFPGPGGDIDYFESMGKPIAERKTWLYDQYIQFLRFAHLRIAQAEGGISALLTNRGFLQHVTMRGLRYQWLRCFDRIEIHDFQGGNNRTSNEHLSIGENVFGVRSGIALSLLCRRPSAAVRQSNSVRLFVHRGNAVEKLSKLKQSRSSLGSAHSLIPAPPLFQFQALDRAPRRSSATTLPLDQCFVCKSSAIVTARDSLVIGMEPRELLERIELLRDVRVSDFELRDRLFPRSRSQKYPRGDTRGWKLAEARARISLDPDWEKCVRRCSYRPLDDRYIYWHPKMVDWRRESVSALMFNGNNPALIARRQLPDDPTANFFWVTRWPTIDGILRSDNRGNESVFPLFKDVTGNTWNFSPQFLELASGRFQVEIDRPSRAVADPNSKDQPCDQPTICGADLFGYLVALVFSDSYRRARQAAIQHEFVEICLTPDVSIFRQLARMGTSLVRTIAWHDQLLVITASADSEPAPCKIEIPAFADNEIRLGTWAIASDINELDWQFKAGHHQVCRKWLADRRGREFNPQLRRRYRNVCSVVKAIRSHCAAIEAAVDRFGGWECILS